LAPIHGGTVEQSEQWIRRHPLAQYHFPKVDLSRLKEMIGDVINGIR
jgi:hypothetical protein